MNSDNIEIRPKEINKARRRLKQNTQMTLIAIPFIVFIFIFCYLPLSGWILSVFNYKPGIPLSKSPFVGLFYFKLMFTNSSSDMIRVMTNTMAIGLLMIITTPLPAVFAILISELKSRKLQKLVQTFTTLPNFISWVIVFSLSFSLFSSDGVVNAVLSKISPSSDPVNILANAKWAWIIQIIIFIWKTLGWNSIIYLAAITGIDQELYDAVWIDGAGRFQSILHVTIPGIIETYFVLLLLTLGSILSTGGGLEQFLMFVNPVVQDKLEVLDYYVYRLGVTLNDVSFSTAIGISKTFVSISLLFGANFLSKKVRGNSLF